jgi:hypothetical protein
VDESLTNVYNNEQGSTIRFTKHNPAHDNLRQELFAQLDAAPVTSPSSWISLSPYRLTIVSANAARRTANTRGEDGCTTFDTVPVHRNGSRSGRRLRPRPNHRCCCCARR